MPDEDGLRIIGFRATLGPLFNAALPLRPGLTVLYGLNGAGKTSMIQALHAGLSGTRMDLAGSYIAPHEWVRVYVEAPEGAFSVDDKAEDSSEFWHAWYPGRPTGPCVHLLGDLRDQALGERVWELDPSEGRPPGHPSWKVGPAVWLREGSPAKAVFEAEAEFHEAAVRAWSQRDPNLLDGMRSLWFPEYPDLEATGDNLEWAEDFFSGMAVLWDFEDAPLFDDGLPHRVTYLDMAYEPAKDDSLKVVLLVESTSPNYGDLVTRRMIADQCRPGACLSTSDGWVVLAAENDPQARDADRDPPMSDQTDSLATADIADRVLDALLTAGVTIDPGRDLLSLRHRPVVLAWLRHVQTLANSVYARLLLDAPHLQLHIDNSTAAEFGGTRLSWKADRLPLILLSKAQLRWANLAIRLALEATLNAPGEAPVPTSDRLTFNDHTFLLLDEPEAAMHRTAERHLAAGLAWLASQGGMNLVIATHSPHLLDQPDANVFRVYRRPVIFTSSVQQLAGIQPLKNIHRAELSAYGLNPSDLLARTRVVLLVEGQHDELIVDAFLSRILTPGTMGKIQILAVRGAAKLHTALESRLLFDFTDATVVPLVDNLRPEVILAAWDQALVLAAAEGEERAGDFLRGELPAREAAENGFIAQFLSRAVALGVQSRVSPFALPAVDITDYLPVTAFVPKGRSWNELRTMHAAAVESGETKEKYFKTWVSKRYSTNFSDGRIRTACNEVEGCPSDFQALADVCARLCE